MLLIIQVAHLQMIIPMDGIRQIMSGSGALFLLMSNRPHMPHFSHIWIHSLVVIAHLGTSMLCLKRYLISYAMLINVRWLINPMFILLLILLHILAERRDQVSNTPVWVNGQTIISILS